MVKKDCFGDKTDAELLALFQKERNSEWLGLLLQRYTLLLFGVCFKYLKNEDTAKDAVQQIFLKVLTEAERHHISYFKSWLYAVAKNHCLMQLREQQGRKQKELTDATAPQHEDLKNVDLREGEATYTFLEQALLELTPQQQTCINLFYLQKQSYQQINAQTGFSLLQIKSYIQNGKRNLKIAIERKRKQEALR